MTLKMMLDFKPTAEEMAMLPLDILIYCKVNIISFTKKDNYDFIRYLINEEDTPFYFKDLDKTRIYDFDGTITHQEKFITIFELFGIYNYENTSYYLKELLERYDHTCTIIIDFYTQDNKAYRLSNLEDIVKLEQMKF